MKRGLIFWFCFFLIVGSCCSLLQAQENAAVSESKAPKAPVGSRGPFKFECAQGGTASKILKVKYYDTQPSLLLAEFGGETRPAFQVLAASGAKYEGDGVMYWEWHGEATVNWSGVDFKCKPQK